ncbi:MAG: hypothetical protein V4567_00640, partial [Pseudomonadota bacterium]
MALFTTNHDSHVFFRARPARTGNFLLRGQEKVTTRASGTRETAEGGPKGGGQDARSKEKATPVLRFSSIHGRKIRAGRPGLPTRLPWRGGKWAQSLAPTLRAFSSGPHRSTGAPQKRCFAIGHPGLIRSKYEQSASPCQARTTRAIRGPSNTASGRRISPKDGP